MIKKLLLILLLLLLPCIGISQTHVQWYVNDPGLGKVIPHKYMEDSTTTLKLCAEPSPYGTFDRWRVRYYFHVGNGSDCVNDTIYDTCVEAVISHEDYYEIVYVADFNPLVNIDDVDDRNIVIYPNPVTDVVWFSEMIDEYYVFDSSAAEVIHGYNTNNIDMAWLEPGVYFIRTNLGNYKIIKL